MLSAGVDVGAEYVKAVILDDRRLLAHCMVPTGWDTDSSVQQALRVVRQKAAVDESSVESLGATGMGRETVSNATISVTDSTCSGKGAIFLRPSARTVIDIGAEQSQCLTCSETGKILEFIRNDNCAAGAGAFIEEMASALEVEVQDMGRLSLSSARPVTLNSTCAVFAESEVISLMSQGVCKEDIARAICDAIAVKAASLLRGLSVQKEVVFIGGVALNGGVVAALSQRLQIDIVIPDTPRIVTALGAALLAQSVQGQRSK
jgi:predicted CoA-substrate-specific enzyme activase